MNKRIGSLNWLLFALSVFASQQKIILLKVGKTRRGTATAKKIQYVEMFQKQDSRDVSDLGRVNISCWSSRLKLIQDSNCAHHPFFIFLQTQNGGVGGRSRKPVLQNKADSWMNSKVYHHRCQFGVRRCAYTSHIHQLMCVWIALMLRWWSVAMPLRMRA